MYYSYYCSTQSFPMGKTSYPFYFYPLHFISPKYLETILNPPIFFLPFSISPRPDTTESSWANAGLSNSPKQHLPWEMIFYCSSLIYLQSACTTLGCQDATSSTWCCLWGNSRAIEAKRDLPPPGTTSLLLHFPRNSAALPCCFFKWPKFLSLSPCQRAPGVSIQKKERTFHQLSQAH